jgi:uncharacterized protein (TIGR03000 family)
MYSLVLMAALVGSAETPDFGRRGSCDGGYGCTGGGCHGGGRRHGCHGGGGSCCGSYGGGYGCTGYSGGCSGGYGGGYGCTGGYAGYGCTGGYAGYGCTGGMMYAPWGGGVMPGADKMPPADKKGKDGKDGKDGTGMGPAPATIRVSLPADAKLLVDSYQTTSTSESRLFVSPALEPEKEFSYTLTAEIVRNGEKMTVSEVVKVRAGVESVVSLPADKFTSTVAKK